MVKPPQPLDVVGAIDAKAGMVALPERRMAAMLEHARDRKARAYVQANPGPSHARHDALHQARREIGRAQPLAVDIPMHGTGHAASARSPPDAPPRHMGHAPAPVQPAAPAPPPPPRWRPVDIAALARLANATDEELSAAGIGRCDARAEAGARAGTAVRCDAAPAPRARA